MRKWIRSWFFWLLVIRFIVEREVVKDVDFSLGIVFFLLVFLVWSSDKRGKGLVFVRVCDCIKFTKINFL